MGENMQNKGIKSLFSLFKKSDVFGNNMGVSDFKETMNQVNLLTETDLDDLISYYYADAKGPSSSS
jgi:hypothetical protein